MFKDDNIIYLPVFMFFVLGAIALFYSVLSNFYPFNGWEPTKAIVTEVTEERLGKEFKGSDTLHHVTYTYVVDGINYNGEVLIPTEIYLGNSIDIIYNPEIPEQSASQ